MFVEYADLPRKKVVIMLVGLVIFTIIAALDVASILFGRDTRDGQDWLRHRSAHAH